MAGGGQYDSKSPETELSGDISGKLKVLLTESDDESKFSNEGLVEEEKLEEIMQELYKEITSSSYYTSPSTLTLPSPSSSSLSPLSLSSMPSLAVSDVKSESCGASMSDSSSTVMAGIEFVGPAKKLCDVNLGLPKTGNGLTDNNLWIMEMGFDDNNDNKVVGGGVQRLKEEKMEGCDEGDAGDDQWLERVLSWRPLELEDWT
ncbi:hypothetical protein DITRI_Ditri10aG0108700 [Diplodiscus trichospermus]